RLAALMATAQKQSWALVALDCAIDTSTLAAEAMTHVLATFGQFERRVFGQRTKEELAAKKASGVRRRWPTAFGQCAAPTPILPGPSDSSACEESGGRRGQVLQTELSVARGGAFEQLPAVLPLIRTVLLKEHARVRDPRPGEPWSCGHSLVHLEGRFE